MTKLSHRNPSGVRRTNSQAWAERQFVLNRPFSFGEPQGVQA
jgi:hypothetical protein